MRLNLQTHREPTSEGVHFTVSLARGALAKALDAVNGRAEAHTAASHDVFYQAELAEAHLQELGILKWERRRARRVYISGEPVTNAYARLGYFREATRVVLERGSRDWFVVSIKRVQVDRTGGHATTHLTPEQAARAVDNFSKTFCVLETPTPKRN
tara:strand:+ start:218 stop:685 length:468 start_codon:yes stop_codon:yes gene_type:complete